VASSGDLVPNTWYHAAAAYDGTAMRLYLNGTEVGSVAKSGTMAANAAVNANIGRNPDGSNYFSGLLDEIKLFDRGLSAAEIALLAGPEFLTTNLRSAGAPGPQAVVRNAVDPGSPNFCTPGGIASIFGTQFTASQPQAAQSFPLPTELGGVRVRINGRLASLLFVSNSLVNFQCPFLEPHTPLEISVESTSGEPMATLAATMHQAAPAIFSAGLPGSNQAIAVITGSNDLARPRVAGFRGRPAKRGESVSIFATGLGLAPPDNPVPLAYPVRVYIGEIEAKQSFVGLASGSVGFYQVNAAVPHSASTGPAIPVRIEVVLEDGTTLVSNPATIAIEDAPGGP